MSHAHIEVMLDKESNEQLSKMALKNRQSLSATAANLIKEALERHEDHLLSRHGDQRVEDTHQWIGHNDAWQDTGK